LLLSTQEDGGMAEFAIPEQPVNRYFKPLFDLHRLAQ
jgi:hypothetical protein